MDIVSLITLVGVLSSVASALTEYLKSVWDASGLEATLKIDAEGHKLVVQSLALASCLFVAFVAQFDVIHALFASAPISDAAAVGLSGVLLFLPADGLKVILEAIKAIRDAKEQQGEVAKAQAKALTPVIPG